MSLSATAAVMLRRLGTDTPAAAAGADSGGGGNRLAGPAALILMLIAIILATGVGLSVNAGGSIEAERAAELEAEQRVDAAQDVQNCLQYAETALHLYLLSLREGRPEPYRVTGARLEAALVRLAALENTVPWLRPTTAALATAARQRIAMIAEAVTVAGTKGPQAALDVAMSKANLTSLVEVRTLVTTLLKLTREEQDRRHDAMGSRAGLAVLVLTTAGGVGAIALGFAALRLLVSRAGLIRAQQALHAQSARLQGTVEHTRDGVAVFDPQDRLVLWNRSFFQRSGLPETLARVGTPFSAFANAAGGWTPPLLDLPRPQDAPRLIDLRHGGLVLEIWRSPMPDGGQMVAIADVTRRTEAEAIAHQSQKLQALGHLTGGVAHDFNNLLQVISSNLEALAFRWAPDGRASDRLAAALAGVERGARLTRHLLAFARRQPLAPEAVDTDQLLRGMRDLLRRTLPAEIVIALVIEPGLWRVRADPGQLENAILNLALNARDAMPDGGQLTIEARNTVLGVADAVAGHGPHPGEYVLIAVIDTGIGMDAEQRARAMEPFYTTKAEGHGTGLGLSMVYGFASQSDGHCSLASELGVGTTVALSIPRYDQVAAAKLPGLLTTAGG